MIMSVKMKGEYNETGKYLEKILVIYVKSNHRVCHYSKAKDKLRTLMNNIDKCIQFKKNRFTRKKNFLRKMFFGIKFGTYLKF